MNLPHEILDEIFSHLSPDDGRDRQSLRNYSLVAKSWTNPSRRHLFERVDIRQKTLGSWLDTISPANDELLQHVHILSYVINVVVWEHPVYRIDVLQDYLPSLHRLQHLTLSSMHIQSDISQRIEIFSAFRYTLSSLFLVHCKITINALVTVINYFSNLRFLSLSELLHEADGEPPSSLSRPLIRGLCISDAKKDDLRILNQLSELGPIVDNLTIARYSPSPPRACLIADSLGVNAKRIRLVQGSEGGVYTGVPTMTPANSNFMLLQAL